jgi:hypothetical protein
MVNPLFLLIEKWLKKKLMVFFPKLNFLFFFFLVGDPFGYTGSSLIMSIILLQQLYRVLFFFNSATTRSGLVVRAK